MTNSIFDFIQSEAYRQFLFKYGTDDVAKLRLKQFDKLPFDKNLAITQIECRRKAINKIPELAEKIVFPTDVSIEQCTSEQLAKFHASLFDGCDTLVDLTCGLGVDSYYLSQQVKQMWSIEANPTVTSAAEYNFSRLGRKNIHVVNLTAEEFTQSPLPCHISAMFVDPSRRLQSDTKIRTYSINQTVPDLSIVIPNIIGKCDFLIVKASPMVDITQTLRDFQRITDIWVLALKNDCKELLFKIDLTDKVINRMPTIHTINFDAKGQQMFDYSYGETVTAEYANPTQGGLLCVPNSAVMKAGAYGHIASAYGAKQISANSHLLTTEAVVEAEFPGKVYRIAGLFSFSKSDIKRLKEMAKSASISCRNIPLSPDELRKRLKIGDGGNFHIFATTLSNGGKTLILCEPAFV